MTPNNSSLQLKIRNCITKFAATPRSVLEISDYLPMASRSAPLYLHFQQNLYRFCRVSRKSGLLIKRKYVVFSILLLSFVLQTRLIQADLSVSIPLFLSVTFSQSKFLFSIQILIPILQSPIPIFYTNNLPNLNSNVKYPINIPISSPNDEIPNLEPQSQS